MDTAYETVDHGSDHDEPDRRNPSSKWPFVGQSRSATTAVSASAAPSIRRAVTRSAALRGGTPVTSARNIRAASANSSRGAASSLVCATPPIVARCTVQSLDGDLSTTTGTVRRVKMSTLAALAAAASLVLAGCSTSTGPTAAASPSAACPMVGPNGCETASAGANVNASLDPHTEAACAEIAQLMAPNAGLDLVDAPLQMVVDDAAASPNIDVRSQSKPLHDAWLAADKAKGTPDEISTKYKLATEATKMETACVHAGFKSG